MQYKIKAHLADGTWVFDATTSFIPNKGDEIEAVGCIFRVDTVRYELYAGSACCVNVKLILSRVR